VQNITGPGIETRTHNVVLIRTQSIHFSEHTTSTLDISFRSLKTTVVFSLEYCSSFFHVKRLIRKRQCSLDLKPHST